MKGYIGRAEPGVVKGLMALVDVIAISLRLWLCSYVYTSTKVMDALVVLRISFNITVVNATFFIQTSNYFWSQAIFTINTRIDRPWYRNSIRLFRNLMSSRDIVSCAKPNCNLNR